MQRFSAKIVSMMKQEKLFASQGGPIILSQVIIACLQFSCWVNGLFQRVLLSFAL